MSEQDYIQLTLFQEDSHANHFPWLESKKEKGTTVTYGRKCSELSESLRQVGLSVRTYLESCELPGKQFVRTWSVRDTLSPYLILKLRLSERRTEEKDFSLWPTATTRDWKDGTAKSCQNVPVNCLLGRAVHIRSTPTACEWKGRGPNSKQQGLAEEVKMWPTLREFCHKDSTTDRGKGNLGEVVGGQLNPTWVEALMGFPASWTELED